MSATHQANGSKFIVIVEDNPDIRSTLIAVLQGEGYRVAAAANGQEALELLDRVPEPACLLLDLEMPVLDGRDFVAQRNFRNLIPNTTIIVFSAGPEREFLPGVVDWIKKPVDLDEFIAKVERYCGCIA